jgi:adenylosuccinate lyase
VTSFDTVDTAARMRLKTFFEKDFFPELAKLSTELKRWGKNHSSTPQVGRTHGQWAVPTFFGLLFGEAVERLEDINKGLLSSVNNLRGQASGAVGGYQALGLLVKEPLQFETKFLKRVGLAPHLGSTQILPPEDIAHLANQTFLNLSVVAKLATDMRHLARSEIGEIAEGLVPGQVGSSTMPQKRNPWNLEHICSLYKVLQSKLNLIQIDLISEHQRDLTNSASGRFYVEFFAVAYLMVKRLNRVLARMEAFPEKMKKHLDAAGSSIYAEAFYVLATKHGVSDAHSKIREASREAEKAGVPLIEVALKKNLIAKDIDFIKLQTEVWRGPESKMNAFIRLWSEKGQG